MDPDVVDGQEQLVEEADEAADAHEQPVEDDSSDWVTASESDDQPSTSDEAEGDEASRKGLMQRGCTHYKRRCKLVAPCCGEVFWCRHCHNHVKDEGELVRGSWGALFIISIS